MNSLNKWVNTFHNTSTYSTLSIDDVEYIVSAMQAYFINSKDKDVRKLKRLQDTLCPHKLNNCSCFAAFTIKE